ncbi:MAG: hypothetical protein GEV07_17290 [Streptosporangiales bacterium]|nr:hypothetical protein [Streptosporangiales bacterium]
MRRSVLVGAVCLVLAVVFWLDLDASVDPAGIYPVVVLITLAVLGVAIVALALLDKLPDEGNGDTLRWRALGGSVAVLLGWAATVGLVGFATSSVAAFLAITWIIRRGKLTVKRVILDIGVAVVLVVAIALLFLNVFAVPLPVSTLFGI